MIEYSDLPPEQAQRQDEDGNLVLWAGSIAVHVFDTAFLLRMADDADSLPFHHARKKVPHIDARGVEVEPDAPNAIKFERFIFDLLPAAKNALAVESEKRLSFAPVKNASGAAADTRNRQRQPG